jgi:hypothetical protein
VDDKGISSAAGRVIVLLLFKSVRYLISGRVSSWPSDVFNTSDVFGVLLPLLCVARAKREVTIAMCCSE